MKQYLVAVLATSILLTSTACAQSIGQESASTSEAASASLASRASSASSVTDATSATDAGQSPMTTSEETQQQAGLLRSKEATVSSAASTKGDKSEVRFSSKNPAIGGRW